jgi:LmbE family N-acetylglucosaminyl deacetylase
LFSNSGDCKRANVLFIGAHPDDIELGCGGTLIKHVQNGDNIYVLIFTDGEQGMDELNMVDRQKESLQSFTFAGVSSSNVTFLHHPDTELWRERQKVMAAISLACEKFKINLVYTHSNKAYHQDHVTLFEETVRGAKKVQSILAYETHGGTNPNFCPTLFVDISDVIEKKIGMLNFHKSQISKKYLNIDSVLALAQFRSSQSDAFHYAEAFELIKMNISNSPPNSNQITGALSKGSKK